jgi:signal transduction histidine kinase
MTSGIFACLDGLTRMSLVADSPSSTPATPHAGARDLRWLIAAGYVTWFVCGMRPTLEIMAGRFTGSRATTWLVSFLIFGVALTGIAAIRAMNDRRRVFRIALLAIQSVSGLAAVFLSGNGTTSALLVIVAAEVPHLLPLRTAVLWIGVQAVANTIVFSRYNWINGIAVGGFQAFALASSVLAARERAARHKLAAANRELLATRARLAESSRDEERLRIARDLHDALGHHLTALSLQLEVASQLDSGGAAAPISEAYGITRLLLRDVRAVVGQIREPAAIDLSKALTDIASASRDPSVHVSLPESFEMLDNSRAQALFRAAQEIITNAGRHAGARNVWIEVSRRDDGIELLGRDDGRGSTAVVPGYGLSGMRERFEGCGGHVTFSTSPGQGFEVRAFLPHARAVS